MQEELKINWNTSDIAEGFDELNKTDLSQTFWRLVIPFAKDKRKLIITENPGASGIYREWASYGNRLPQKSLMTKVCSLPFLSRKLYKLFTNSLDPEVVTILEYVAIKGALNHEMLEKELGIVTYEIENEEVGAYNYRREIIKLLPKFRFLPARLPSPYYFSSSKEIIFTLPKILQKAIAILAAEPEAFLPSYEKLPEEAEKMNTFYGEELILRELPGLIIYLNNKRPKLSKKGRPNIAAVRSMGKKLALTTFYPNTKQKELSHLRANLLASLLLQLETLPNNKEIAELVKHLFQNTFQKEFRSALHLLTYVTGMGYLRPYSFRAVEFATVDYFKPLYQQGWVDYQAWERQKQNAAYGIDFIETQELNRLSLTFPDNYDSPDFYTRSIDIAPYYGKRFVQWPILRGHLFLLASWGVLDLAYEEPDCTGIGITCDSPYDGVKYVRLTSLGAYVLGYTDTYETTVERPFELSLSDDVLSILLTAGDMELASRAIASFASPVGDKRFQTNADMFLQDCNSAQDLKQKIDLFSTLFPGDLPVNWQAFFRELSQKANPLSEEDFQVFSINPNDQTLLQLLARDEKIRALCSKAEGYRILVKSKDFKRLQKLLRAYGYLVE